VAVADSCFLIDLMHGHAGARRVYSQLRDICVPAVVVAELMAGVEKWGNEEAAQRLMRFLSAFRCVSFTCEMARVYGKLYAALYSKGEPIPAFDMMIAATALSMGERVITSDKHFKRIEGLERILY